MSGNYSPTRWTHQLCLQQVAMHGHVMGGLYAGVPVLDARAKAECRRRLNELRQDLNEAERFNGSPPEDRDTE